MLRYPTNKPFRDALLALHPQMRGNPGYMALYRKLLFCPPDQDCLVPHRWLAAVNGYKDEDWRNFDSGAFLDAFRRDVLPGFVVSRYRPEVCRRVLSSGLTSADVELVDLHLSGSWDVWLDSGRRIRHSELTENRRAKLELVTEHRTPAGRHIMRHHNSELTRRLFARMVNENFEAAKEALLAAKLPLATFKQMLIILCRLRDEEPQPIYKPSLRTDRVFTLEPSIPDLKREVRKALLSGCYDIDLQNIHLALAAHLLDIRELKDFLATGASFWSLFPPESKPAVKTAVYSICYGAGEKRLRNGWDSASLPFDEFWEHPLVKVLRQRLNEFVALLNAYDKDAENPYWQRPELVHPATGESIRPPKKTVTKRNQKTGELETKQKGASGSQRLSLWFQAYEMELVYPIYQVKGDDYQVVLIQHDGVTVKLRDDRRLGAVKKAVDAAVAKRGEELGIPGLRLSWEHLGATQPQPPSAYDQLVAEMFPDEPPSRALDESFPFRTSRALDESFLWRKMSLYDDPFPSASVPVLDDDPFSDVGRPRALDADAF